MSGALNPKLQHIRRRKSKEVFEAIQNGDRSYEVCANTPDLTLDVGDVITFQEVDDEGKLTGRAFTKKVLRKEPISELKSVLEAEADGKPIADHDYAILSLAEIRYRSLKSIYEFALTLGLAVDICPDKPWEMIEGPFCSPPLASPDLIDLGTLNGLHLNRWPTGRYSIMLMARVTEAEKNTPIRLEVIDLMVLTIVRDTTPDQRYGGIVFEELDPLSIMDGQTININGIGLIPLSPLEIEEILNVESDRTTKQYDQTYDATFGSLVGDSNHD